MAQAPRPLLPQMSTRHAFGAAVRDLRVRRGLSQADLGSLVFVSKDQIGKVEKAIRWPAPELVAELDQALGADGLLTAFGPSLESQRHAAPRLLPRVGGSTLDGAALDWIVSETGRARLPGVEAGNRVEEQAVAAATQQLAWFRQLDHQHGAGRVHHMVSGYVATELEELLASVPVDGPTAVALYSTAAGFWELTGYQAIDLSHDAYAHGCYLRALELASAAGDRLYGGYLLSVSSAHLALHGGDIDQALRMARAGLHGTTGIAGPGVRSAFQAVLARAEARRGDEKAATRALLRAENDLERSDMDDEPAWIRYFTPAYLADEMAHCFHDLGHHVLAQEQAAEALSHVPAGHVRRLAIDTALMASSLARAGEPERACAVGRRSVEYAAQTASARTRHRVAELRRELVPYAQMPEVIEFGEFVQTALPA